MNVHLFQDIIEELLKLHSSKKYLTYDDIMDICDAHSVPLTYTESILTELTDHGCKIFEHVPTEHELNSKNITDNDFESIDYAQIDYEALYDDVLRVDPELKAIIQYVRQIRPAQHGEATYIFKNQDIASDGRKRLFDMSFRSVIKIAFQQYQQCDEELADLIQIGSLGLLIAINKYDVSSGSPFASYANAWIFQAIGRELTYRKNGCYFPVYISETLKQIDRMVDAHVCNKCNGTKLYCPALISEIQKRYNFSIDEIKLLLSYTQRVISYESLYSEIDDSESSTDCCLVEKEFLPISSCSSNNPYEMYCRVELKERLNDVLIHLSQREQEVIRYRFGFFDGREWTLEEVGNNYGITRERVRQIESSAIRKMRHPKKAELLQDFWE